MYIFNNSHFESLETGQKAFLEAWFNLTHERSLDSFRLRCHNGRTILAELKRESGFEFASTSDIALLAQEAQVFCANDPILPDLLGNSSPALYNQIALLAKKKPDDDSKKERRQIKLILADLLPQLDQRYLNATIQALESAIAANLKDKIPSLTGILATEMAARGWALSGLHRWVESHFLVGAGEGGTFAERFGIFANRLKRAPQVYQVVVALSGNPELPRLGLFGGFEFSETPPSFSFAANITTSNFDRFLRRNPHRTFATASVEALDNRAAAHKAQEKLAICLDRLRFNFARDTVMNQRQVLVYRPSAQTARLIHLDSSIPSPEHHLPWAGFLAANQQIADLIASGRVASESRRRIEAALRHYRLGLDGNSYHDKLLNWWMGLETLTNAGEGKGIGDRVVKISLPLLALDYFEIQLQYLFGVLGEACGSLPPRIGEILPVGPIKHANLEHKLSVLQDSAAQAQIAQALQRHPWVLSRWNRFVVLACDPKRLLVYLEEHELRVRWHLLRLYRIRCCLIHGTPVDMPLQLPSANLEFYLRATIHVCLDALVHNNHIEDLESVFERATICLNQRREILNASGAGTTEILRALTTGIVFQLAGCTLPPNLANQSLPAAPAWDCRHPPSVPPIPAGLQP